MKAIRIPRSVRHAFISVGVLLVVAVVGGVAYTYFMGRNSAQDVLAVATPVELTPEPVIKPTPPAANAKASASVQSVTSPVALGSNASMTVRTNAGSTCAITFIYNKISSTDSGLVAKVADDYGMVSWTWTVEKSVPLGTWPATATCTYNGKTAVVKADLVVKATLDE